MDLEILQEDLICPEIWLLKLLLHSHPHPQPPRTSHSVFCQTVNATVLTQLINWEHWSHPLSLHPWWDPVSSVSSVSWHVSSCSCKPLAPAAIIFFPWTFVISCWVIPCPKLLHCSFVHLPHSLSDKGFNILKGSFAVQFKALIIFSRLRGSIVKSTGLDPRNNVRSGPATSTHVTWTSTHWVSAPVTASLSYSSLLSAGSLLPRDHGHVDDPSRNPPFHLLPNLISLHWIPEASSPSPLSRGLSCPPTPDSLMSLSTQSQ